MQQTGYIQLIDGGGEEDAMQMLIKSLGQDAVAGGYVKAWRINPATRKEEACVALPRMSPLDFAEGGEEALQNLYGAGDYRLQVYAPNPNNGGRISARGNRMVISIAEPSAAVMPQQRQIHAASVPVAPIVGATGLNGGWQSLIVQLAPTLAPVAGSIIAAVLAPRETKSVAERILEARMLQAFAGDLDSAQADVSPRDQFFGALAKAAPQVMSAIAAKGLQSAPKPNPIAPQPQPQLDNIYIPAPAPAPTPTPAPEQEQQMAKEHDVERRIVTSHLAAATEIIKMMQDSPPDFGGAINYLEWCSDEIVEFVASEGLGAKIVALKPELSTIKSHIDDLQRRALKHFYEPNDDA